MRPCSNCRTIALIPHASKIILRIIQDRLATYIEREISEEQAGFRKGRETRDQIANIRWILERTIEYSKTIMCFIDYSKAFDCVDHSRLWNTLRNMGVPEHLIALIRSLYANQEASVRTEYGDTEWFAVRKVVRQGCNLFPYLFNMFSEYIVRKVGCEDNIGIKVGGRTINNLRYADDTTILAKEKEDLEKLLKKLKEESEKAGLSLNLKKTKIITTGTLNNFVLDGTEIEITSYRTFLCSIITRGGNDNKEINRRLSIGRMAMTKLEKIMKDRDVTKATKIKIAEPIIFPTVTYGSESWTVGKRERKKNYAFGPWTWRRIIRVPWTEKRTNFSVLEDVKPKRSLEMKILRLKLRYFGHVMRAKRSLELDIMLGQVEGHRKQGKSQMRWLDSIKEATGLRLEDLREAVQDRKKWRTLVEEKTRNIVRTNVK
jgi:hypothetical protein